MGIEEREKWTAGEERLRAAQEAITRLGISLPDDISLIPRGLDGFLGVVVPRISESDGENSVYCDLSILLEGAIIPDTRARITKVNIKRRVTTPNIDAVIELNIFGKDFRTAELQVEISRVGKTRAIQDGRSTLGMSGLFRYVSGGEGNQARFANFLRRFGGAPGLSDFIPNGGTFTLEKTAKSLTTVKLDPPSADLLGLGIVPLSTEETVE